MQVSSTLSAWMAYQFASLIKKPFIEWEAYDLGLIDEKGDTVREPETSPEKEALNPLKNLVRKIKRVLVKYVGDSSALNFLIASYLVKEHCEHEIVGEISECLVSSDEYQFNTIIQFLVEKEIKMPEFVNAITEEYGKSKSIQNKVYYDDSNIKGSDALHKLGSPFLYSDDKFWKLSNRFKLDFLAAPIINALPKLKEKGSESYNGFVTMISSGGCWLYIVRPSDDLIVVKHKFDTINTKKNLRFEIKKDASRWILSLIGGGE